MSKRLTDEEIAGLRNRDTEAAPEWFLHEEGNGRVPVSAKAPDLSLLALDNDGDAIFFSRCDAAVAVEARNALPALLDEVTEARRLARLVVDWHRLPRTHAGCYCGPCVETRAEDMRARAYLAEIAARLLGETHEKEIP